MTLTMIPLIRFILIFFCLLFMWVFAAIGACGISTSKQAPFQTWRRIVVYPIRIFARLLLFFAGFYWIPTTEHKPQFPRPNIIIANHISFYDGIKILADRGCCFAAKKELFSWPIIGSLLKALQCLPIDRNTAHGRKQAVEDLKERAGNLAWPPLCIFPQGTTTNDLVLTTFKAGAFIPGKPVLPVAMTYPNKYFDLFYGNDYGTLALFWRSLCQVINYTRIDYLPVYTPTEAEQADAQLYANNVRQVLANHMKLPTTEHDYADMRLAIAACSTGLDVNFTAKDMHDTLGLSAYTSDSLIIRFREMCGPHTNVLTFDAFCEWFKLDPKHSVSHRLFALFDTSTFICESNQ
jgi:lysophosphatidylcholine acyltransferase / lyso-PAF acetyltransferase